MDQSMKLIHLTDLHLMAPGKTLYGFDPAARLRTVIATINNEHADADLCVITGDLTDEGDAAAYQLLRDILQDLRVPHRLLLGNHDHRANFLRVFPDATIDARGFVQSVLDVPAGRLIFLDTLVTDHGHGSLGCGRFEWLLERLAEEPNRPSYVFCHHPLQSVGLPHFAPHITLVPRNAVGPLVKTGSVRHIFCGHVHVDVGGTWQGVPFSASRGVAHQIIPHLERRDARFVNDAPAFNVALIRDDSVLINQFEVSSRVVVAISPEEFMPEGFQ
ncbi:3',5'-cyclic-nucleotide phosphodiesterase (plasmid) [Rhizobium grahamii CCGE 502]|uniref:3',5'-cyclic-nucleotide phosphodiesterase n=2 Tax=Rhizobium grahamii TaxID=1120045 RepID=S3H590_9HYPH|nr:3',5'-cyclic-nucleotide phosphodiesterase [Rhizobium grahamii CCGE 502]